MTHTKKTFQRKEKDRVANLVARYSRGNVSLKNKSYLTKEDKDKRFKALNEESHARNKKGLAPSTVPSPFK